MKLCWLPSDKTRIPPSYMQEDEMCKKQSTAITIWIITTICTLYHRSLGLRDEVVEKAVSLAERQ